MCQSLSVFVVCSQQSKKKALTASFATHTFQQTPEKFLLNFAILYNSLPSSIQSIEKSTVFKSALGNFWVKYNNMNHVSNDIVV